MPGKVPRKPTLNAGCGIDTWGDVRIDVQRYSDVLFLRENVANVIADVQLLPFRKKSFSQTRCFHVLEHIENPRLAFKELVRVSDRLIVRVPVWHFNGLLLDVLTLFFLTPYDLKAICTQVRAILRWKKRLRMHKWYIRFKGGKVNRFFGIPKEYELTVVDRGN